MKGKWGYVITGVNVFAILFNMALNWTHIPTFVFYAFWLLLAFGIYDAWIRHAWRSSWRRYCVRRFNGFDVSAWRPVSFFASDNLFTVLGIGSITAATISIFGA